MKLLVAVLAIMVAVQATQIQTDIQKHLADQQYADHPFGKSMVNLLSLNMQTGEPLRDLIQLLQSIKDEIISLTQTQDQEQQTSQRRCQVDIAQLTTTAEQAGGDLDSQRSEQQALLGEQTNLNNRVKEDTAALERNGRSQNETADRINSEDSDFESKQADYADAIQACKEAQRLLMNLRTESATSMVQISQETQMNLIQTKEQLAKIKTALEQHSKKTSLTLFQPIIEGLVEMSTKVNPETLNNVLNLIARLITALQEGQDQLNETHGTQVSNLQALKTDLQNERQTLQNSVSTGNNRLKEIQSRLNELDGLLANSNAIVEVTNQNIDDAKASCQRKEEEYNNQTVSRKTELDILDRLIEFVNDRLASAV